MYTTALRKIRHREFHVVMMSLQQCRRIGYGNILYACTEYLRLQMCNKTAQSSGTLGRSSTNPLVPCSKFLPSQKFQNIHLQQWDRKTDKQTKIHTTSKHHNTNQSSTVVADMLKSKSKFFRNSQIRKFSKWMWL